MTESTQIVVFIAVMLLVLFCALISSYMILYYLFKRRNAYKQAFDMEKRAVLIEKYERSFTRKKYHCLTIYSISCQIASILLFLVVYIWLKNLLQFPMALPVVLNIAVRLGGTNLIICVVGLWILRKPPETPVDSKDQIAQQ